MSDRTMLHKIKRALETVPSTPQDVAGYMQITETEARRLLSLMFPDDLSLQDFASEDVVSEHQILPGLLSYNLTVCCAVRHTWENGVRQVRQWTPVQYSVRVNEDEFPDAGTTADEAVLFGMTIGGLIVHSELSPEDAAAQARVLSEHYARGIFRSEYISSRG